MEKLLGTILGTVVLKPYRREISDGGVGSLCGACREYLMQLDRKSVNGNYKEKTTITLNELIPDWWGKGQMNANCDL